MDAVTADKKSNMTGQMTLFDMASDEDKKNMQVTLPKNLGEYDKDMLLQFEKEILGVYVTGHPLEDYAGLWDKVITTKTEDFYYDEETGSCQVQHNDYVKVAGIVTEIKLKYTKKNEQMAFVSLEDLVGTIEVIVFPKAFAKYKSIIKEDAKITIEGRVSEEVDKDAKLMCERIAPFSDIRKILWIRFSKEEEYAAKKIDIENIIHDSDGMDYVKLYFADTKKQQMLPANMSINADRETIEALSNIMGKENITVTFKADK